MYRWATHAREQHTHTPLHAHAHLRTHILACFMLHFACLPQLMCAWVIQALAKQPESQQLFLRSKSLVRRAFAAVLRLHVHPAAQESLVYALSLLSVSPDAAPLLNEVCACACVRVCVCLYLCICVWG